MTLSISTIEPGQPCVLGQARARDASTQVIEGLVRNVHAKGAHLGGGLDGAAHDELPWLGTSVVLMAVS
jgi:hypothetical protein